MDAQLPYYKMDHPQRGIAVILNHEKFTDNALPDRTGTHLDADALKKSFENLDFVVQLHTDLELEEIEEVVKIAAAYDHSSNDCFVMAVLSHGHFGKLHAKDCDYNPECLWTPFTEDKCKTLAGKPKIFIIQACQGDRLDGGLTLSLNTDPMPDCLYAFQYKSPSLANFLFAYATVPGHVSYRVDNKGSWFIGKFCEVLDEYAFEWHLMNILTLVAQKVATDCETEDENPQVSNKKQVPYIVSMLTGLIQFKHKKGKEAKEKRQE